MKAILPSSVTMHIAQSIYGTMDVYTEVYFWANLYYLQQLVHKQFTKIDLRFTC